ncbi:MAG: DedA family protein [Clostridium sp.]
MDVSLITSYLSDYGLLFLFIIVFLEYLNLPGFPAGVIMPVAGMWASRSGGSFTMTILVSVFAGLVGSWVLYFVGRRFGDVVIAKYIKKFPKQKDVLEKNIEKLKDKGNFWVFASKLLPVVRTIISIPAGALKMNFIKYTISSTAGIFLWNLVFVGSGYFFGDKVLSVLV